MKLIYIDDSFLQPSSFLVTMRKRLFSYCAEHEVTYMLISGKCKETDPLTVSFYEECKKQGITVIKSPAAFEVEKQRGLLSHSSMMMNDGSIYYPYSGSALFMDTDHHKVERIYFEFFPNVTLLNQFADLEEELIEMLNDVLEHAKKTKHYYH